MPVSLSLLPATMSRRQARRRRARLAGRGVVTPPSEAVTPLPGEAVAPPLDEVRRRARGEAS